MEQILGYNFRNKELLKKAFTHSTYANEHEIESNERLEFLGDSILGFVVSLILYEKNMGDEGVLTIARSNIVANEIIAKEIGGIEFRKNFLTGKCFDDKKDWNTKTKSGLFEAIVGAIYLDSGLTNAREFIERVFKKQDFRKAIFNAVEDKKR